MLRCLCTLFAACVVAFGGRPLSAQEVYEPAAMRLDLERFREALVRLHPGTFTHQSPADFERRFGALLAEASEPLEASAFYRIVLRLIASVHDGHTQAYAFGELGEALDHQSRLPFEVHVQDERVFIVRDVRDVGVPAGSELLAIDGRPSNEILHQVLLHYSGDGLSRSGMYHWLGGPYRPFRRLYSEIFGDRAAYMVTYRDPGTGQARTVQVSGLPEQAYRAASPDTDTADAADEADAEAFDFDVVPAEDYAYMRIARFFKDSFDEPENTFPDFYDASLREMESREIGTLIVDLRDNGGGKASNVAYLLQYFIDSPLRPAERIWTVVDDDEVLAATGDSLDLDISFGLSPLGDGRFEVTRSDVLRDLLTYAPIAEPRFDGELIVLINGGTTSAGAIAAGLLKEHAAATLVGEETFGYAGMSNGVRQLSVRGEHTEVAIYLPLLHADYVMAEALRRRSVVPDHRVASTIDDVLSRSDPVLAFVRSRLLSSNDRR